jgi:HTH-type transcriptional regulator, sugar sensing transcriptional regulator
METIKSLLKDFGITETESEVYLFLSQHGSMKGTELAKQIKKDKAQVYHILRSLQAKGLVESTFEAPVIFMPVTFEKVVEFTIKAKREEAARIAGIKKQLLDYWKNLNKTKVEVPGEKFIVIEGRSKVYAKISQMLLEIKENLSVVATVNGLTRANQFGLYEVTAKRTLKSKVQLRFLTDVSNQNCNNVRELLKKLRGGQLELRAINLEFKVNPFPRMVIRDKDEALFFITPQTAAAVEGYDELCLWTNCKDLVEAFNSIFEGLWYHSSNTIRSRTEGNSEQTASKSYIIHDPILAQKKYIDLLASANKEVLAIVPEKMLVKLSNNRDMLQEWNKKGVKTRILTENMDKKCEKKLNQFCEIKKVPNEHLSTLIVDNLHLLQFKIGHHTGGECESAFYTNDLTYVEGAKNLLSNLWNKT